MTDQADIASLPFEEAMKQLEDIVKRLEAGTLTLEQSIDAYGRGDALKRRCDELLKAAEARIEKISLGPDGKARGSEPLDVE